MKPKTIPKELTIKDVEDLTGFDVVEIQPSKNWMRLVLANGFMFIYKKWK